MIRRGYGRGEGINRFSGHFHPYISRTVERTFLMLKIGATADYPELKATYFHLEFSGIQQ